MDVDFGKLFTQVSDKLEGWLQTLITMLPNLAMAIFVIVLFTVAARLASRVVRSGLDRISSNREINALLAGILRITLLVIGLFVALGVLQLDKTVTSLLAGVGIVGLALGIAFQDIASNFISGVILAIRRSFRVGDLIESKDTFGTVIRLDLRATRIRTLEGQVVIVPNKQLLGNPLTNYTEPGERRVDLSVGVSYGDDLERAKTIALDAVRAIRSRDDSRDVELFYEGFGESSIDFTVQFWIKDPRQPAWLEARSQAVMAIKRAFDDNEVTIPFPIRTLDFAEVGGKRLDQVLQPFEGREAREKAS